MSTPDSIRDLIARAVAGARASLDRVDAGEPADAIGHLQEAARNVNLALNEAMAAGVVSGGLSVRQAAQASGLAPNTLPARLAATSLLAPYSGADRRVRSEGIARARHDIARTEGSMQNEGNPRGERNPQIEQNQQTEGKETRP